MTARLRTALIAIAILAPAASGAPQEVGRELHIGAPESLSRVEFLSISSVRALASGHVIVADAVGERIAVLDASGRASSTVGRIGAGPGEYESVGELVRLPGDTTLLPDLGNGRWHLLDGPAIAATWTTEVPVVARARGTMVGADDRGDLVLVRRLRGTHPTADGFRAESTVLVRLHRTSLREDTLARLRGRPTAPPPGNSAAVGNPLFARAFGIPMLAPEQVAVFADGWIAVARLHPYRVDWHGPAGQVVHGSPLPYRRVFVSERERREYERRLSRSLARPVRANASHPWPKEADAFDANALVAGCDGNVWIRLQTPEAEGATRYQVVGRDGGLIREVTLPPEVSVVGFGDRRIFLRTIDADGAHWLGWTTWPPPGW